MTLAILFEYGRHGFGGYGQGFFKRSHYSDIAYFLQGLNAPPVAKTAVIEFFAHAFDRDSRSFDRAKFMEEIDGRARHTSPVYQQRHFYYMAELISNLPPQMRKYVARISGDYFRRQNHQFDQTRWDKFCEVSGED